jgi:hypothetical protein
VPTRGSLAPVGFLGEERLKVGLVDALPVKSGTSILIRAGARVVVLGGS